MINNIEKKKSHFYTDKLNSNSHSNFTNYETLPKNTKNSTFYNSKKDLNINDFINQKNKFYIQDFFNEKEAKKFLDSKKKALMEIILDDDKNNEYEIELNKINNNTLKTELMNKSDDEENSPQNKKNKVKRKKDKSSSQRKKRAGSKRKKHNKNNNNNDNDLGFKQLFTINGCDKNDKDNSQDSDYLYKFIIDNANETEENFFKKLKKEIKRVETKKEIQPKKNTNVIIKSLTIKNSDIKKKKNNKSDINPFDFSETAKILMTKEDIEVSSIGKDDKSTKEKDKNQLKTWGTMYKTGNGTHYLLNKKEINENNINNNNAENGSDKKSLISLLSELVEI